jgi:hypothetical protein
MVNQRPREGGELIGAQPATTQILAVATLGGREITGSLTLGSVGLRGGRCGLTTMNGSDDALVLEGGVLGERRRGVKGRNWRGVEPRSSQPLL